MSAEAAKAAFEVVKQSLPQGSGGPAVILATVKGDIHDIGKNIVRALLENYGYSVIDLGKDVAPEVIARAAAEKNVRLVGLSALMTTTVPSMAETIKLLRREVPDCKVMVGGAVLTEEYGKMIDADRYAKNAMEGVRYAAEVFSVQNNSN
jgi:5-methyltetrahydrofolate--homocysteine methyltransferase